jgi:hypothetical protein
MTFDTVPTDHIVTILGAPRSGTTWLAKIFDSHPDVLYRHEPDWLLQEETRDVFATAAARAEYDHTIRQHFHGLAGNNRLKSSGSLPRFAKSYRRGAADALHAGLTYALRGIDKSTQGWLGLRNMRVPDLFRPRAHPNLHIVVKSVSFQIRARQLAQALPGTRIVFIVRDPYGQVASMLRGAALGKFERPVNLETMACTEQARRYGLTAARLETMSAVERYSWHWAIYNEMTIDDIAGLENVRVVRYDALCDDPVAEARQLFAFAGLSWNAQTAEFLERSTRPSLSDGYYQVFKDPSATLHRWRTQLDAEDKARIHDVIARTAAGAMWLDRPAA